MPNVIRTIWEVARALFDARARFEQSRRDRRQRVATYFSDMAELLENTAADLRRRTYPHGSCAQLETLAQLMPRTLRGIFPPEELRTYRDKLLAVHRIEQLFYELEQLPNAQLLKQLEQLDAAAGQFRALAAHLRVL